MAGTPPGRPAATPAGRGRQPRADARRNITAILDAAVQCLARDPQASIADIARAADVGRVTLYGHFASRGGLPGVFGHRAAVTMPRVRASGGSGEPPRLLLT